MKRVIIATPAMDGRVDAIYAYALAETVRLGMANGVAFLPIIVAHDAMIDRVRNDLLAIACKSDAEAMIWIDSDEGWQPEWCLKLLSYGEDVVGGTARHKRDDVESYVVKADRTKLQRDERGLIEVEGLGCGFLHLSRKAMDTLWSAGEPYDSDRGEGRWVFDVHLAGRQVVSEDIAVMTHLREGGFRLWLDPAMTCEHAGAKVWRGDCSAWLARINDGAI